MKTKSTKKSKRSLTSKLESNRSSKPSAPIALNSNTKIDPHSIIQLQRTIGNHAVLKLLQKTPSESKTNKTVQRLPSLESLGQMLMAIGAPTPEQKGGLSPEQVEIDIPDALNDNEDLLSQEEFIEVAQTYVTILGQTSEHIDNIREYLPLNIKISNEVVRSQLDQWLPDVTTRINDLILSFEEVGEMFRMVGEAQSLNSKTLLLNHSFQGFLTSVYSESGELAKIIYKNMDELELDDAEWEQLKVLKPVYKVLKSIKDHEGIKMVVEKLPY